MNSGIRAICFDVGGTLRATQKIEGRDLNMIRNLQSFTGEEGDPFEFVNKLHLREQEYRRWCMKSLVELTEADLWTKFILPDHPAGFIRKNAIKLNQMWRDSRTKKLLPDAIETLKTLANRGFKLAIISNTTSSVETPQMLEESGLTNYFSSIILSTVFGRRKPHPSLFLETAKRIGMLPEECAYVGDNPARDLVGARQAGFGGVVIIKMQDYQLDEFDPDDEPQKDMITEMKPDFKIGKLSELIDLFPQVNHGGSSQVSSRSQPNYLYEAALSTMWGVDQSIPFNDTFVEARKIGFERFELNHKVSQTLYKQWDSNRFYISTVHDPCPAIFSSDQLTEGDILISSLDESRRLQSIELIKRTIELACNLGARSVVIHPGTIQCDRSRDKLLRNLFQKGLYRTPKYEELKDEMIKDRVKLVSPHIDQVVKSLQTIIGFTKTTGISIGLENRYRYYHLPLPDEMELLLGLCKEEWFGFQYDTGHAFTLDALGLVSNQEWLDRFSKRIVGVHLHDVIGITDHQVPGLGNVDFKMISSYLPDYAMKTLEIGPQASIVELTTGLEVLVESGCINKISDLRG